MPESLSDLAILGGVLLWDGLVVAYILRLARTPWQVPIRAPKPIGGRVTFDRDEWGQVVEYEHETD